MGIIEILDYDADNANQMFFSNVIKPNLGLLIRKADKLQREEFLSKEKLDDFIKDMEKLIDVVTFMKYLQGQETKPYRIHPEMKYACEHMFKEFANEWFDKQLKLKKE